METSSFSRGWNLVSCFLPFRSSFYLLRFSILNLSSLPSSMALL